MEAKSNTRFREPDVVEDSREIVDTNTSIPISSVILGHSEAKSNKDSSDNLSVYDKWRLKRGGIPPQRDFCEPEEECLRDSIRSSSRSLLFGKPESKKSPPYTLVPTRKPNYSTDLVFKSVLKGGLGNAKNTISEAKLALALKCPLCLAQFQEKESLELHLTKVHRAEGLHLAYCNEFGCGSVFIDDSSQREHMTKIHLATSPSTTDGESTIMLRSPIELLGDSDRILVTTSENSKDNKEPIPMNPTMGDDDYRNKDSELAVSEVCALSDNKGIGDSDSEISNLGNITTSIAPLDESVFPLPLLDKRAANICNFCGCTTMLDEAALRDHLKVYHRIDLATSPSTSIMLRSPMELLENSDRILVPIADISEDNKEPIPMSPTIGDDYYCNTDSVLATCWTDQSENEVSEVCSLSDNNGIGNSDLELSSLGNRMTSTAPLDESVVPSPLDKGAANNCNFCGCTTMQDEAALRDHLKVYHRIDE